MRDSGIIPLFVYGTLQPRAWNFRVIEDAVVSFRQEVTIRGGLYFVGSRTDGYPVAKLDEKGTIHGTLLIVDTSTLAFDRAHSMEISSGYEPRWVPASLDDRTLRVTAYHYLHKPGLKIESGCWEDEYADAL